MWTSDAQILYYFHSTNPKINEWFEDYGLLCFGSSRYIPFIVGESLTLSPVDYIAFPGEIVEIDKIIKFDEFSSDRNIEGLEANNYMLTFHITVQLDDDKALKKIEEHKKKRDKR